MATGGHDEAILNSNNMSISTFNKRASTVCLLVLPNGDSISRKASGFLAKFKLDGTKKVVVIMSNHFVGTPEEASRVQATFGYEGKNKIVTFELDANIFFRTNKELDYTFVGIRDQDVTTLYKEHDVVPIKLEKEELRVQVGEVIHIPQHMEGKPKRISYSKVCGITDTEVFYEADTSCGSSGSPVLYGQNEDLHPLAVHKRGGVMMYNGIRANKGMLMSAILNHLRQHSGMRRAEYEQRLAKMTEGGSSDGKKESGLFVGNTATTQGLPVVQTQSEKSVPSTNSDAASSSLVQETENPSLSSSHSQSSKSPMSLVQPPQGPPPVSQRAQVLCSYPFESRELVRIARRISDNWRIIAKCTGYFKEYEITNITGDSSLTTTVLLADRMLNDFKSRLGKRKDLADAIHEAGLLEVAQKVRSGFYIDNCYD